MTAIVWFRRDLRIQDHPALLAAAEAHERILPVFCLDERLLLGRHASGARTQFLLESLADLDGSLRDAGSRLLVRRGRPEEVLPELIRKTGAKKIYATRDLTPFARLRGRSVEEALDASGERAEIEAYPGLAVIEDVAALRTKGGTPYSMFTPFHHSWADARRRRPLPAPQTLPPWPEASPLNGLNELPALRDLGLRQEVKKPQLGGERAGLKRMHWFLDGPIEQYARTHDVLDVDGTSKLGAYLHFGCISPRALEAALPTGTGADAFRRQLCWRDFYHYVLFHNPGNSHDEFQPRYRGTLDWTTSDERRFAAWAAGRTGYPLVDAAMRQLLNEGWMHNRARMMAGSFLVKQLGVDWRRGEAFFMRMLLDGDQANNNGNWQWAASVGVDPQPVSRRMYNPTLHQQRYDPDGRYVRAYLPELGRVPAEYLAEPWTMPTEVQRKAECVIGTDYPAPIVDLREARTQALARYRAAVDASSS